MNHCCWQVAPDGSHEDEGTSERRESRETYDSSSGSATELSSLLPLSSLLSSLNPPSSPLLAAFLASRRELPGAVHMPGIDDLAMGRIPRLDDQGEVRARRPKHSERSRSSNGRSRRAARTMVPLTSVVTANTHVAHSQNDTTQGAVHCYEVGS